MQNNRSEAAGEQRPISNLPILSLDELLNVDMALSYYLDYLSVMNLQRYVIFYLMARGKQDDLIITAVSTEYPKRLIHIFNFHAEWKATTMQCLDELRSNKLKSVREEALKVLRDKANEIYLEV